jgi:hypothetical protein
MKQKDLGLIAVAIIFSAIFSFILSSKLITSPKNRQQTVEKVNPISADFPTPDNTYFNSNSIDPTQLITIGNNTNPQPFNGEKSQ